MTRLVSLLAQTVFSESDILQLLALERPADIESLREAAYDLTTVEVGNLVHYRGLVEVSNICALDCHYCGIRKGNSGVERYCLTQEDVVEAALWCVEAGYGSCVLQSGERRDAKYIDFVAACVAMIKAESVSEALPQGLGVTLSLGEQTLETYQKWREAGAHRYLLRIETTNPELFARIHPASQRFETRARALDHLRAAGFQVGTGVMIGLPGQTLADLAADVRFFSSQDIDMIGMGPYIVSEGNSMPDSGMMAVEPLSGLALRMIAVVRLVLRDVNIAATTALQALIPDGREKGIAFGANITMPNITPREVRKNYQLYAGKPGIEEDRGESRISMERRVNSTGRQVGWNRWGDSRHHYRRMVVAGS
ncbi:MAG: [FeFe] hydrogenase H-cluster radical SAM maturase HydE [Rhodospirillaceae bacterium]